MEQWQTPGRTCWSALVWDSGITNVVGKRVPRIFVDPMFHRTLRATALMWQNASNCCPHRRRSFVLVLSDPVDEEIPIPPRRPCPTCSKWKTNDLGDRSSSDSFAVSLLRRVVASSTIDGTSAHRRHARLKTTQCRYRRGAGTSTYIVQHCAVTGFSFSLYIKAATYCAAYKI